MSRNLRIMFTEIASFPLEVQKKMVHEKLISWMGKNKQIDDVLVIGGKVWFNKETRQKKQD